MSVNKPIQLGLCCLNITLRHLKTPIYPSRTIIQRKIKEDGIDELKRRVLLNCQDLIRMIEWNEQNGIKVFRITSNLFPHKANPDVENYSFDFAKDLIPFLIKEKKNISLFKVNKIYTYDNQYLFNKNKKITI